MNKYDLAKDIIKYYEGFSHKSYICPAGIETIGYGRTSGSMEPTTVEAEEEWLQARLFAINDFINRQVHPIMNDYQMAALMSFIYNVGSASFKNSTLLKYINVEYTVAPDQFLRWVKGPDVLPGLVKRRMTEYLLFKEGSINLF